MHKMLGYNESANQITIPDLGGINTVRENTIRVDKVSYMGCFYTSCPRSPAWILSIADNRPDNC
jgi:hypothetical protein